MCAVSVQQWWIGKVVWEDATGRGEEAYVGKVENVPLDGFQHNPPPKYAQSLIKFHRHLRVCKRQTNISTQMQT